jgi:hypothetical protein
MASHPNGVTGKFAHIASGLEMILEVGWSSLIKSFYEKVRIRIACRDPMSIPHVRLYEMAKKLYMINIQVEGYERHERGDGDTSDGDQDDQDGGGDDVNDDDADGLDDEPDTMDTKKELTQPGFRTLSVTKSDLGAKTVGGNQPEDMLVETLAMHVEDGDKTDCHEVSEVMLDKGGDPGL